MIPVDLRVTEKRSVALLSRERTTVAELSAGQVPNLGVPIKLRRGVERFAFLGSLVIEIELADLIVCDAVQALAF
jgi:hypothetical protein